MRNKAFPAILLLSALVLIAAAPGVKASYLWGIASTCTQGFGANGAARFCSAPNITVPSDCANITSDVVVMSTFIGLCDPFSYNYLIAEFSDTPYHFQYNLQSCPARFESETYEYFPAAGGYKSFAAGDMYPVGTQSADLSVAAAVWCARTGLNFIADGNFTSPLEAGGSITLPWLTVGSATTGACSAGGVAYPGICANISGYTNLTQTLNFPDINTLATITFNASADGCSSPEENKACVIYAFITDGHGNTTNITTIAWDDTNNTLVTNFTNTLNLDIYGDKYATLHFDMHTLGGSFVYLKNVSITAGYDQTVFCGDGTCNGIESSSSCAMDCGSVTTTTTLPGTPTTTTTLATTLTPVFDAAAAALGTTAENSKMFLWVVISLVSTIGVAVYAKKTNWQLLAIIFLSLLGVGVVIGWVAAWIGIALIVVSVVGIIGKFK